MQVCLLLTQSGNKRRMFSTEVAFCIALQRGKGWGGGGGGAGPAVDQLVVMSVQNEDLIFHASTALKHR